MFHDWEIIEVYWPDPMHKTREQFFFSPVSPKHRILWSMNEDDCMELKKIGYNYIRKGGSGHGTY